MRAEDRLMGFIREKIKDDSGVLQDEEGRGYTGFDMSGYNDSFMENINLMLKFTDYLHPKDCGEDRNQNKVIPTFWKGSGELVSVNLGSRIVENLEDITSKSTEEILFKILTYQNKDLLLDLGDMEDKKNFSNLEEDLEDLIDDNSNYKKTKIIDSFKRNISLVKELKEKHNKCQICGFTFKKKDGKNYNEVHHIIPLSKNGKDSEINTLVLCANCHRQLHYADIDISKIFEGKIIINGEEKIIYKIDALSMTGEEK